MVILWHRSWSRRIAQATCGDAEEKETEQNGGRRRGKRSRNGRIGDGPAIKHPMAPPSLSDRVLRSSQALPSAGV